MFCSQPPDVCSAESGVRAAYILEVRSEAGEVVYRTAAEYHQSDLIENSLTVDTCSSYSVNITVFVPSFPELGSHTNISQLDVSLECPGMQSAVVIDKLFLILDISSMAQVEWEMVCFCQLFWEQWVLGY